MGLTFTREYHLIIIKQLGAKEAWENDDNRQTKPRLDRACAAQFRVRPFFLFSGLWAAFAMVVWVFCWQGVIRCRSPLRRPIGMCMLSSSAICPLSLLDFC